MSDDAESEREIHQRLKSAFKELADEPVPEKFSKLLKQLEEKEKREKKD